VNTDKDELLVDSRLLVKKLSVNLNLAIHRVHNIVTMELGIQGGFLVTSMMRRNKSKLKYAHGMLYLLNNIQVYPSFMITH
jgi:hypothetical protein